MVPPARSLMSVPSNQMSPLTGDDGAVLEAKLICDLPVVPAAIVQCEVSVATLPPMPTPLPHSTKGMLPSFH